MSMHVEAAELFSALPHTGFYWTEREALSVFAAEPYSTIIATQAFRRLRGISFLGAIDYVFHPNGLPSWRRHTRYQHSLGVAALALRFAQRKRLPPPDERLLVCAALLHDIGHAPLSHTLEPVFSQAFGIDHHKATEAVILGRQGGDDVRRGLECHGIAPRAIIDLINGTSNHAEAFLFSSPINVDTIEGIPRSKSYISKNIDINPEAIIDVLATGLAQGTARIDGFWEQKQIVYRYLINSKIGFEADNLCRTEMWRMIDQFSPVEFLDTEVGLRRRHRHIFDALRSLRKSLKQRGNAAFTQDGTAEQVPERRFIIDQSHDLAGTADLGTRYRQQRGVRTQDWKVVMAPSVSNLDVPSFFA